MKAVIVDIIFLIIVSLCCCVPDEIILPGDISGYVTDAETEEPVESASVVLSTLNTEADTSITGNDGIFEFNNAPPGFYEVEVSKPGYVTERRLVNVETKRLYYVPFPLTGEQYPAISETLLDFGVDSVRSFTIKNLGKGELEYFFRSNLDWIAFIPEEGIVTTETDTITVTIDRDKLPRNKIEEVFTVFSSVGKSYQTDEVQVTANGMFYNGYYFGIVRIGTQIWFAENLNVGTQITHTVTEPSDNGIVEKYCYDDDIENCITYGGLYEWNEMMDYEPPDNGLIGATQGICPEGWHIPTLNEFETLVEYLGGEEVAGGKLKAIGTKEAGTGLWKEPNEGATNESGFTALPGGRYAFDGYHNDYYGQGEEGNFWSSSQPDITLTRSSLNIDYNTSWVYYKGGLPDNFLQPVRCIKDE